MSISETTCHKVLDEFYCDQPCEEGQEAEVSSAAETELRKHDCTAFRHVLYTNPDDNFHQYMHSVGYVLGEQVELP